MSAARVRTERPVLIVKTGSTIPDLVPRRGDFEDWVRAGLGLSPEQVRVVSVFRGEPLPAASEVAGVVVTGSSAMVSAREDWSERTASWLRSVVASETPLLGICYGHQLLAHAFGGEVNRNPKGREIGTVEVRVDAPGDPLLAAVAARERFHATHVESALTLPDGALRLAASDGEPNAAFRLGRSAWGVQFHPEFDAEITRGYLAARRTEVEAEGLDYERIVAQVVECPAGPALLARFARLVEARFA